MRLKDYLQNTPVLKAVLFISSFTVLTFSFMKLISPYSRALTEFLLGFFISFILITLFACYIKYIVDLFMDIISDRTDAIHIETSNHKPA